MMKRTIIFAGVTLVSLSLLIVALVKFTKDDSNENKRGVPASLTGDGNANNPSLNPNNHGKQPFLTEFELRRAIDVHLDGNVNPDALQELESIYGPLEDWDVSQIHNFANLFDGNINAKAQSFNGNVSMWNVSNALHMHDMFKNATSFNGNLSLWQVDHVRTFNGMFENAISFEGIGLDHWNTSSGEYFMVMLAETSSLDPTLDLRQWDLGRAQNTKGMFRRSNFGSVAPQNQLCHWRQQLANAAAATNDDGVDVYAMFLDSACPQTGTRPSLNFWEDGYMCGWCPAEDVMTAPTPTPTPAMSGRQHRPNILWIVTDQQRFDTLRRVQDELWYYDNVTKIETPNLDRLSYEGAYFRQVYCQCSVCAPARATLRTGCTVERTGIQHNDLEIEYVNSALFQDRVESVPTLDRLLVEHGNYVSEHYGKWHLPDIWWNQGQVQYNDYNYDARQPTFSTDPLSRKTRRFLEYHEDQGTISTSPVPEGMQADTFSRVPYRPSLPLDARFQSPSGTPLSTANGFAEWQITEPNVLGINSLNASFTNTYFIGDTALKALDRLLKMQDEQANEFDHSNGDSGNGSESVNVGEDSNAESRTNGTEEKDLVTPWFLTVSFHNPHPPMVPAPTSHLEYYLQHQDNLFVSHNIQDTMQNSAYKHIARADPNFQNRNHVQAWTALYYSLITEIDEWVGALLDKLEEEEALEDTLIIFTSDHGEMLGAHGDREKNKFYEESARVPLLISWKGVIAPNTTIDTLTNHLDIVATILDYVGLSDVDTSDGSSLRPSIENESFNENYDEDIAVAEWDFRKPLLTNHDLLDRAIDERPSFMIRKGQFKLLLQKTADSRNMDMMFDLEQDPFELQNLLGSNAPTASVATREQAEYLRCLLLEWMERMDGPSDIGYYSSPVANYGEGNGDIWELTHRQTWPALDFWASHSNSVQFGRPVWNGGLYIRKEYVYVGTRTIGTLDVAAPFLETVLVLEDTSTTLTTTVQQGNAISSPFPEDMPFSLSLNGDAIAASSILTLRENQCVRLELTYSSPTRPTSTTLASLVLPDPLTGSTRVLSLSFAPHALE